MTVEESIKKYFIGKEFSEEKYLFNYVVNRVTLVNLGDEILHIYVTILFQQKEENLLYDYEDIIMSNIRETLKNYFNYTSHIKLYCNW